MCDIILFSMVFDTIDILTNMHLCVVCDFGVLLIEPATVWTSEL
jgi:hypothetical protein